MTDHFVFARILNRFLPALKQTRRISPDQAATCQNILNCHTPVLGGLDYACGQCGSRYPRYHKLSPPSLPAMPASDEPALGRGAPEGRATGVLLPPGVYLAA